MTEFKPGDWIVHPIDKTRYYYVGNQPDGRPVLWWVSSIGWGERMAPVNSLEDYNRAPVEVKPGQYWRHTGDGFVFKVLEIRLGTVFGRSHNGNHKWGADEINSAAFESGHWELFAKGQADD